VPVLRDRVVALLSPALAAPAAVLVDATIGLGGHTEAFLAGHPELRVVGLDRDPQALAFAQQRLAGYTGRLTLVHAVYDQLAAVLVEAGIEQADAVLFDLGVSSLQLDEVNRGFSYSVDAPLDMRMDPTQRRTAADVVNDYSARDLARLLREYGEERFASRIAAAIVLERAREPLQTTGRL